jgi:hypothetical protein
MNDARVRRMPTAQKAANALLALLAVGPMIALRPGSTALLVGLTVPLGLALLGSTQRARSSVAMRGWALAANAFGVIFCAGLLVFAGVGVAQGRLDAAGAGTALAIFGPFLVLYVLNLRVLVGPPVDDPVA